MPSAPPPQYAIGNQSAPGIAQKQIGGSRQCRPRAPVGPTANESYEPRTGSATSAARHGGPSRRRQEMPPIVGPIHDPALTGLPAGWFRDPPANGRAPTPSGLGPTGLGRIALLRGHPSALVCSGLAHTPSCTRESAVHHSVRRAGAVRPGICPRADALAAGGTSLAIRSKGADSAVQNRDRPFPCAFRSQLEHVTLSSPIGTRPSNCPRILSHLDAEAADSRDWARPACNARRPMRRGLGRTHPTRSRTATDGPVVCFVFGYGSD